MEVEWKFSLDKRKYGLGVIHPQPAETTCRMIVLSIVLESGYNGFMGFEYNPKDDSGTSLKHIKILYNEVCCEL